jgi:dephospho-CoA kinase
MHIALTGGIGSGKTYVCRLLKEYGVEVYDCDAAAKRLMNGLPEVQSRLSAAVGCDLFANGRLDKATLSRFIVKSEENVQKINSIVHPAVAEDFKNSGMEWLESAILYESGFDKRVDFDLVVCVTAPLETRIQRVMSRDSLTREKAMEWIGRQMPQEEKVANADFEIVNDGERDVKAQLRELMTTINKLSKQI